MLKINKKVEYALVILKHMADQQDRSVSAREICDKYNTPFDTTAKVMQSLKSDNLLSSVQGAKGGYQLQAKWNKVSYMALSRIVEGKEVALSCQQGKKCSVSSCNIVAPIGRLSLKINNYLEDLTLQELLFGE